MTTSSSPPSTTTWKRPSPNRSPSWRKTPNNAKAYFALGTLSHFQGEIEQAIQYFQKSIELNPADAAPHLSLGRLYAVRGEYKLAWKHARAAEALGACDLVEMLERYPNLK